MCCHWTAPCCILSRVAQTDLDGQGSSSGIPPLRRWLAGLRENPWSFLREIWKSVSVPWSVANDERVARRCSPKALKKNKKLKPEVFLNANYPYEISLDRMNFCDARGEARNAGKGLAVFVAERVRSLMPTTKLAPYKPPSHHSMLWLFPDASRVRTKEIARVDAKMFSEASRMCEDLASIVDERIEDP